METEDLILPKSTDWVAILKTGTTIIIQNNGRHPFKYRFGVGSTSEGIFLQSQDIVIADNDIYIQSKYDVLDLRITRD